MIKLVEEISENDLIIHLLTDVNEFQQILLTNPRLSINGEEMRVRGTTVKTVHGKDPFLLTFEVKVSRRKDPRRHLAESEVLLV